MNRTSAWWQRGVPALLLLALLAFDAVVIVLAVGYDLGVVADRYFDLGTDRGLGETFGYVKLYGSAVLLAWLWWLDRHPSQFVLVATILFLLVDDAGMLHERVGIWVANDGVLPDIGPVGADDLGQLAFAAMLAAGFAVALIRTWPHDAFRRAASRGVVGCILVLGLGGVAVDLVHSVVADGPLEVLLGLLEDGLELVSVSALAAFALAVVLADGNARRIEWSPSRVEPLDVG